MILLQYAPSCGHAWVGCSFDEAEQELLPFMDRNSILNYLEMKKCSNQEARPDDCERGIKDIYELNEVPDVFAIITRKAEVTIYDDPFYPFCALVPPATFECCDHIRIKSPAQMKRLCVTHNGGEPFPDQPAKRRLFFDMDGVLVDFQSAVQKISPNILAQHNGDIDEIDGIFALMDPIPGAIEAARTLSRYYDCHILSTSPWDNVGGYSDKMRWIQEHLGDVFYKKVTFTHHKEFLNDGESLLIDDRKKNGADAFGKNLIEFNTEQPDWESLTWRLIRMAEEEGSGIRY